MPHRARSVLRSALLAGFAAALGGAALGLIPIPPAMAADPNLREVSLVRQDQSDCQNGNVSDKDPALIGGTVWVVRGSDGTTRLKIGITTQPNTTYHFFLKCVRQLGDVKTSDEGVGEAEFSFPTSEAGNVFAFDMYPEGAPLGNKYQSVQVKF